MQFMEPLGITDGSVEAAGGTALRGLYSRYYHGRNGSAQPPNIKLRQLGNETSCGINRSRTP
jgi:hypothetical protein